MCLSPRHQVCCPLSVELNYSCTKLCHLLKKFDATPGALRPDFQKICKYPRLILSASGLEQTLHTWPDTLLAPASTLPCKQGSVV